ncbi:MAG: methyltransferase domain-containing protein [Planctomycetes bacterium]|nr:methyltransferase domain-containing protein [Planctomycetota bacterium]
MLFVLVFAALVMGEDKATLPPPLTQYMGRTIAQTMHWEGAAWLTRGERAQEENTDLMLRMLKLQPGQTVCDLGCGNGYHTLRMAAAVGPTGRVFGEDIQPEMLTMLNDRADAAKIANVTPILGTLMDPRLPDGSCDMILLVDVYHEISYPQQMLAAIRKALKPTGRVVLVEFRAEDPKVPIKPLHKMSKAQVDKELTANGFKLAESFDDLPWQHMLFYERDDAPAKDK